MAAILAADGSVMYNWHEANGFRPGSSPPGPKWLRELIGDDYFQTVIWVQLRSASRHLLPQLRGLKKLETLIIVDESFGDEESKLAATLSQLHALNISDTRITDQGLTCLQFLPSLETLILSGPHITGACLQHVVNCTRLKELRLYDVEFTVDQMEALGHLPHLERLELKCSSVTDNHLKCLSRLKNGKNLKGLLFYDGAISDQGCRYLEALTGLQILELPASFENPKSISRQAVIQLKKALPNCLVFSDFTPQG